MPALKTFHTYLTTLPSPTSFSGPHLLEIMSTFQDDFSSHMRAEVSVIASLASHHNTPPAGSAEEKAIGASFDKKEGMALLKSGVTDVVPFFFFNFEGEFEEGLWRDWPPIPGVVRWGILKVAGVWHGGWWRFACCDGGRRRRGLFALGV